MSLAAIPLLTGARANFEPVSQASVVCITAHDIRVKPAVPRAGALFHVLIATGRGLIPSTGSAIAVGEPLHFHAVGDTLVALAAVPVDSTHGIPLVIRADGCAPLVMHLATQSGAYKMERLSVAPQFASAPDSTLTVRMNREAAMAAAVSRASHSTPRLWTSPFMAPRPTRITSPFGGGRIFNSSVTSRHMGTDFAGTVGEPVVASNRGVVRLLGAFYLGGNVIYIDHGEGIVTAYLHLSTQLVAVGDTVREGQTIGNVGATGRVTGPHLHFIARFGNITVDAASLLLQR